MKGKKASAVVIGIIILASMAVVTTALFLYPYSPQEPPQADDAGFSEQGIQQVVNANNHFAFDLYSELIKSEQGNIFYSPYSISSALAMTYEGARGQTAEEIKEVFYFPENDILKPNFAAIYNNINKKDKSYELRTGNALWLQKDYPFLEDFITNTERYYGGKAANLDFVKETEKSRQTINSFIEEQTNDKIKDLIPQGVLDAYTRLVLTNAIYFKGTWEWEFDKSDTKEQDFNTGEEIVKVPMMYMKPEKVSFNYADLENLQILELPYKGDEISMLILLPKQGADYDFETGEMIFSNYTLEDIALTSEKLEEYKSEMSEIELDSISIPKFEFDSKYFMVGALKTMGMPTAFDDVLADFSGTNGLKELYISSVIHQAYVKVDEKGTEAAAATGVVIGITSAEPRNIFNANHPFIFIIQEKQTGNILFIGRVINPK